MQPNGKKVAVLAVDDYENLELWYPHRSSSLLQGDNKSVRIIGDKMPPSQLFFPSGGNKDRKAHLKNSE